MKDIQAAEVYFPQFLKVGAEDQRKDSFQVCVEYHTYSAKIKC